MEDTYNFIYHGHTFKKDEIIVVKVSPWIASIKYRGQGWTIPLSEISPIFRSFLEKTGRKNS